MTPRLPSSPEAERAVLGAIILNPGRAFELLKDGLCADDFFVAPHAHVYAAALALRARGEPVDVVTLSAELGDRLQRVGGIEALGGFTEHASTAEAIPYHAAIVAECSARRRLIAICGEAAANAASGTDAADVVEQLTKQATAVNTPAERSRWQGLELEHLDTRPPAPTRWLVNRVIPEEACMVLGAEEKTGKSWLAFLIAICVVTGRKFLADREPRRMGKVLIYSPESGWNARAQRLWALCNGLSLNPAAVLGDIPIIRGRVDLADVGSYRKLRTTVRSIKPMLLILDPLIACYMGADENASGEVQPLLNSIRDLIEESPGMSVLVAHHLSKGARDGNRSPFHGLRGSTALGAWSDGLIGVRKVSDEWNAVRRIDIAHRDAISPPPSWFRIVSVGEPGALDASVRLEPCQDPSK